MPTKSVCNDRNPPQIGGWPRQNGVGRRPVSRLTLPPRLDPLHEGICRSPLLREPTTWHLSRPWTSMPQCPYLDKDVGAAAGQVLRRAEGEGGCQRSEEAEVVQEFLVVFRRKSGSDGGNVLRSRNLRAPLNSRREQTATPESLSPTFNPVSMVPCFLGFSLAVYFSLVAV